MLGDPDVSPLPPGTWPTPAHPPGPMKCHFPLGWVWGPLLSPPASRWTRPVLVLTLHLLVQFN